MQTNEKQHSLKTALVVSFLFVSSAFLAQAQIQDRPKAGPEQKKMEIRVGTWQYEGILHDTPLGPGGKFKGQSTVRMALDGLYLESRGEDKGVYGGKEMAYKYLSMLWYDPTTKTYLGMGFDNDGVVGKSTTTMSGNVWTETGTITDSKGTQYKTRSTITFSADGKTSETKGELSTDNGKTWKPYWEETRKKVGK